MMPGRRMDRTEHAPTDLIRALEAIRRTQARWLRDLEATCDGDPHPLDAFRRWEELLTLLKLHVHRAEQRLLHYLMVPEDRRRPWRELPDGETSGHAAYHRWLGRIDPYLRALGVETAYRRIGSILDHDEEAVTADAVTDLIAVAEVAETTGAALDRFQRAGTPEQLEDLAFYHVLSPWKQHGMPALLDVLRWLAAYLNEHDEV